MMVKEVDDRPSKEFGACHFASLAEVINLRDLRKPEINEKVWSRFRVPREQTLWYYCSLADRFCEQLPGQLSSELREIVELIEAEKAANGGCTL
jgi:hypothetical protein